MTSLNDWKEILKVQIVNTKQGIKTSQRKLPTPEEEEDCYPPLFSIFSNFQKLKNVFDPSATLLMNWEHNFTPEEICRLKNEGGMMDYGGLGYRGESAAFGFYLTTDRMEVKVNFHIDIVLNVNNPLLDDIITFTVKTSKGKVMKNEIKYSFYPDAYAVEVFDNFIEKYLNLLEEAKAFVSKPPSYTINKYGIEYPLHTLADNKFKYVDKEMQYDMDNYKKDEDDEK